MKKTVSQTLVIFIILLNTQTSFAQFGSQQIITTDNLQPTAVSAADIDGDGFIDVLSGGIEDDQLAWHKNLDGEGSFGNPNYLSNTIRPYKIETADINGDDFLDIWTTSGGDDFITWFENLDGNGNFGDQSIISNDGNEASFADIDGDGDLDLFVISDSELYWKEHLNGNGTFGSNQSIWLAPGGTFLDINAVDIDNDGDYDVMLSLDSGSFWFENLDGAGNFSGQNTITTDVQQGHEFILPVDIDNDGDMDAVVSDRINYTIAWLENTNGEGVFGPQQTIASSEYISEMNVADLDNDGDIDVLVSLEDQNKIVWYSNTDGLGSFGTKQEITTNVDNPTGVFTADLNNDTKLDVLSASISDNKIAWYPNLFPLSTRNINGPQFFMYPNPVNNMFTIEGNSPLDTLIIYDAFGRVIKKASPSSETLRHQILLNNSISNGIYFLNLKADKYVQTITFQKI